MPAKQCSLAGYIQILRTHTHREREQSEKGKTHSQFHHHQEISEWKTGGPPCQPSNVMQLIPRLDDFSSVIGRLATITRVAKTGGCWRLAHGRLHESALWRCGASVASSALRSHLSCPAPWRWVHCTLRRHLGLCARPAACWWLMEGAAWSRSWKMG